MRKAALLVQVAKGVAENRLDLQPAPTVKSADSIQLYHALGKRPRDAKLRMQYADALEAEGRHREAGFHRGVALIRKSPKQAVEAVHAKFSDPRQAAMWASAKLVLHNYPTAEQAAKLHMEQVADHHIHPGQHVARGVRSRYYIHTSEHLLAAALHNAVPKELSNYKRVKVEGTARTSRSTAEAVSDVYERAKRKAIGASRSVDDDLHRLETRPITFLEKSQNYDDSGGNFEKHMALAKAHRDAAERYRGTLMTKFNDEGRAKLHDEARRLHLEAAEKINNADEAYSGIVVRSADTVELESRLDKNPRSRRLRTQLADVLSKEGKSRQAAYHLALTHVRSSPKKAVRVMQAAFKKPEQAALWASAKAGLHAFATKESATETHKQSVAYHSQRKGR
jgi:thioredoxin-like negative regulator of GroEL